MVPLEATAAIIASKLHIPRLSFHHIPRPRLTDRLNQLRDRPVILLCAPAGSGKSTLLSEWLVAAGLPTAWVSLDERDDDLITFFSYMLAAVQPLAPTGDFSTQNLLRATPLPPLETLSTSLSNDLHQIDADFVLVLDDYHLITNPQIDEVLDQILRHPPRRMHLAVATRSDPVWPLATLRTRGQLGELRFADLRFSAEESAAFVRKALGDAVDQDRVAILHEESEGWAAGLQLMALVAEGRDDEPASDWREAGRTNDIATYLFGEVFDRQPQPVQDYLLQLSILGRFSASLCAAVCHAAAADDSGDAESLARELITDLQLRNIFIVALDARHEFFRFHHVFQRFLADRLGLRATPEHIVTLHRRASEWFAARGLVEEALDHALEAGDELTAADLVAQHRHDFYNQEQFSRLTRLLRLLPYDVKERNPELLLAEARIAIQNWRFTEAEVFLDHAAAELSTSSLPPARIEVARGELAVLLGILDLWAGNAERLHYGLQRALPSLPPDASHLRGLAHMGIATAYWQLGDPPRAKAYLDDLLAQTSPQLPVYPMLLQARAFLYWVDGEFSNLQVSAQRLLNVSRGLDLPDQIALAHYLLGTVHYAHGELEAARQELTEAVAARFNMQLLLWSQAVGVLALTEQALGRHEDARQTLAEANDFLLQRHALRILPNLGAFQAELDRQQGLLADASAWAARVEPGALTWSLGALDPQLAQARIFLFQDRASGVERAALLLAELHAFSEKIPNRRLSMEAAALSALLADHKGDREAALESLERLVLEAEPEGWVRLFVDLGDPMERLLRQLAARRVAPHAIAHILGAFPPRHAGSALGEHSGLAEPLSERELEILDLLMGRESNKEIAERLFIAPSTVKHHTLNIYRKLEVNDRREAVVRARQLGLLPAE